MEEGENHLIDFSEETPCQKPSNCNLHLNGQLLFCCSARIHVNRLLPALSHTCSTKQPHTLATHILLFFIVTNYHYVHSDATGYILPEQKPGKAADRTEVQRIIAKEMLR